MTQISQEVSAYASRKSVSPKVKKARAYQSSSDGTAALAATDQDEGREDDPDRALEQVEEVQGRGEFRGIARPVSPPGPAPEQVEDHPSFPGSIRWTNRSASPSSWTSSTDGTSFRSSRSAATLGSEATGRVSTICPPLASFGRLEAIVDRGAEVVEMVVERGHHRRPSVDADPEGQVSGLLALGQGAGQPSAAPDRRGGVGEGGDGPFVDGLDQRPALEPDPGVDQAELLEDDREGPGVAEVGVEVAARGRGRSRAGSRCRG